MLGLSRNEGPPENEDRSDWSIYVDEHHTTSSGLNVTTESAMQLMAVHGSVRMISESIATMPVDTFRQEGEERVSTTPPRWLSNPTSDLDWVSFLSQVLTGLLLDGNSYSEITYDSEGTLREIIPIENWRVSVTDEQRRKVIRVNGAIRPRGSVLHIPGMMLPGKLVGLSPIEYARQTIGLGTAAMEFGANFFNADGNMPGVIELPRIAQPATKRAMALQWKQMRSRPGKGLPGIIDDGGTWKQTGVNSEQMQFLQTRKYSAGEIAGQLFMLDPTDLGIPIEGSSISYANLNQRNVRRVQVTFMPWIVRLEKAFSDLLPRKQFVKLNVNSTLRGDTKSRYDAYKLGLEQKFITIDEVRQLEELRPLTDAEKEAMGDTPPPPPPPVEG